MRQILILGAGRSASSLIRYLIQNATSQQWRITVADKDPSQASMLVAEGPGVATGFALDATDGAARAALIAKHDLVISMLPAFMHMDVLKDCLSLKKHVITPSYVPDALWPMDADFKAAGLTVLNEMGLDPGIDHMSAMRILDRIREEGGRMAAFESYCGGLVAPESDDNPWGYKFSWNPRNVILAGQGGAAKYIRDGETKYIPYHKLFKQTVRVTVEGLGEFDGYANRDSLKYRSHYGLDDIPTLLRGTLRKAGYCEAWDAFVQLGCTEDGFNLELPADASWSAYLDAFLPHGQERGTRANLADYLSLEANGPVMQKLDWLGLFDKNITIGVSGRSPAATLQHLLEQKWKLGANDKDMVVMWHRFRYGVEGQNRTIHASLGVIGEDQLHTAMARTVGLPIAMACKLLLNGTITDRGVLLPLKPVIYAPILDELETYGITFTEEEVEDLEIQH
ncbi:MAG: saccharopine dehydrogenase NADP-binding domain-containing protein [Flavobacteriales bacterium]|nr:saccharopine dehydrogenase NADP-binding domain-containing protein [Flavobacteriales bacterium]